jgi:glycosyltransferase involved in cell wall biosynthesis
MMDTTATERPDVSVVIPAYNAAGTLGPQLEALAAQESSKAWELVVVDNASTDSTRMLAESFTAHIPLLRVVTWTTPGSNTARNAGIRTARAPLVLLCDADDIVAPGWIDAMVAALATADIVGGHLDCNLLNDDTVRASRSGPTRDGLPRVFWHLPYAISANLGMHRRVFEQLGGFDETLTVGGDEIDFCWRAQYEGFSIAFAPDAVVHYRFKAGLRDAMRQSYRYGKGNARVRALHIDYGRLPALSFRQKGSLVKGYLLDLLHVEQLVRRASRRRSLEAWAWFAGSLVGLVRYGAII